MNEELQKEILKLITETKGFAFEQAPDTIKQFLEASALEHLSAAVFCGVLLLLSITAICFCIRKYRKEKESDKYYTSCWEIPCAILGVLSIVLAAMTVCNSFSYYKAARYPNAYLLDTIRGCR